MIEDKTTYRALSNLVGNNNGVKFTKLVSELLQEGKRPLIAYDDVFVYGRPRPEEPDKIATQYFHVGTAGCLWDYGLLSHRSISSRVEYTSKDGKLFAAESEPLREKRINITLPVKGPARIIAQLDKFLPIMYFMNDGTYQIQRGRILVQNNDSREFPETEFQAIRSFSLNNFRPFLTRLATSERT